MNKHNYFYYFKSIHFVYDKIFNPLGILTQVSKLREGFFYAIKKLTIFQINLYIKFEIVRTDSSMEHLRISFEKQLPTNVTEINLNYILSIT